MSETDNYIKDRADKISIDEEKCQGCGGCVNSCPNGGFKVINGKARIVKINFCDGLGYCIQNCPMGAIHFNDLPLENTQKFCKDEPQIQNWPIKLPLINIKQNIFNNADLIIVADCAPLVLKDFHDYIKSKVVLTTCPKLTTPKEIRDKLVTIINNNNIKSIEAFGIDYICCESFGRIVKDAIRFSNKKDDLLPSFKNSVICLFGVSKSA